MSEDAKPVPGVRRRRRWLWLLVVPPILLAVGLNWLLRTDAGLEVLRPHLVSTANDLLLGSVSIDRISGDLLSELAIEGIEVRDPEGQAAVEVSLIRLVWQPLALSNGEIKVDDLLILEPKITALINEAGELNLARLAPPSDPKPKTAPFPLDLPRIDLDRFAIEGGEFTLTSSSAKTTRVDGVDLVLSAQTEGGQAEVNIAELSAQALEKHELKASLQVRIDGRRVKLENFSLQMDDASLEVPELETSLPLGELRGRAMLHVPAGYAAKLGGPPQVQAPLDLALDFSRDEHAAWNLEAQGELAEAAFTLSTTATESLDDLQVRMQITELAPRMLHTAAPEASVTLMLRAHGNLSNPLHPIATATLSIDGSLSPPGQRRVDISRLGVRTQLQGETIHVQVGGTVANTQIEARVEASHLMSSPVLEQARAQLKIPSLRAILGAPAEGSLSLSAQAHGPIHNLVAEGKIRSRGLRWGEAIFVSSIEADWDLSGLPQNPEGRAQISVREVMADRRPIQSFNVAIAATQDEGATFVDIQTMDITLGGLVWQAEGANLTRETDGTIVLQDFSLLSVAGSLGLDAKVTARGGVHAQLRVQDLNLSALPRDVLPELADLSGHIDLSADVDKTGSRIKAELRTSMTDLRLALGRPPLHAQANLHLDPSRLVLTASVGTDALGFIGLSALTRPPRRMDSGSAWRRSLANAPLEQARIELVGLQVTQLQALLGQRWVSAGMIDGAISIDGPDQEADLQIHLSGLRDQRLHAPADLQIVAKYTPGEAWTRTEIDLQHFGRATITASISAPQRLFDGRGWSGLDRSALQGAQMQVHQLSLNLLQQLGLHAGLEGQVRAKVHVGPNAEPISALFEIQDVQVPQLPGTWSGVSELNLEAHQLRHVIQASLDGRPVARTELSLPLSLDQLLKLDADSARQVPLKLKARISALPLTPFADFAKLPQGEVQGDLTLSIDAQGSADRLAGHLRADIADLRLAETRYRVVTASASFAEGQMSAHLDLMDHASGTLNAQAVIQSKSNYIDAHLVAKRLDLGFISSLGLLPLGLEAVMSADLSIQGQGPRPDPQGWLMVEDLRIAFAQAALQPLHHGKARVDISPESAQMVLDAASGGGSVGLVASAQFPREEAPSFEATTTLKAFPIAAGSLVRIDMVAKALGQVEESGTKVQVTLSDGLVRMPKEDAETLHPIEELDDVVFVDQLVGSTIGEQTETSTVNSGPPTQVSIHTLGPIDVRGGPVDAAFVAELNTIGEAVRGRVYSSEGAITLFRRRYVIEKAQLSFEGRVPPNPRVNVRLRHEFDDLSFSVAIRGEADAPDLQFSASPARFSQSELLTIFLGTDPADLGKQDDRTMEQQAVGAMAGFLVGQLQDKLGRALPIDTLDVELGDVAAGGAGTRVTLGKWITRKLFLAYRYKFEADIQQENDNESVVQYRFLPGWMVEVVLGLTRQDAELLWTKRF